MTVSHSNMSIGSEADMSPTWVCMRRLIELRASPNLTVSRVSRCVRARMSARAHAVVKSDDLVWLLWVLRLRMILALLPRGSAQFRVFELLGLAACCNKATQESYAKQVHKSA